MQESENEISDDMGSEELIEEDDSIIHNLAKQKKNPPHTLTGLFLMISLLLRTSFFSTENRSPEREIRAGLFTSCVVFLFYCTLQLQDGQLVRPHPILWRFVHGITILYFIFLVFLLSQSSSAAVDRTIQVVFEPGPLAALPRNEINDYSINCSITVENIKDKIIDIFFLAHLLGWFIKALILRDWGIMWTCSLMFEVLEVSLQNVLPNFAECWWDRWLMDIFGCNLIGMILGMKFAGFLGAREYDWRGIKTSRTKTLLTKLHLFPVIFPRRFEWHSFSSWRRFGISFLVVIIVLLGEVNGFLLKSSLQIPTSASINIYRIFLMVPAIYESVVELYAFAEFRTNKIGRTAWLVLSIGILEFLISIKNFSMRNSFRLDQLILDKYIINAWKVFFVISFGIGILKLFYQIDSLRNYSIGEGQQKHNRFIFQILGIIALLPFVQLLFIDAWYYGGFNEAIETAQKVVLDLFR